MSESEKPTCALCGEPMPKGEEMFKYHGYSGLCPKPPLPLPAKSERAWLCERSDHCNGTPAWLCVSCGCFNWTTDSLKAIRFARREDAEQIASIVEDVDRITEHEWS